MVRLSLEATRVVVRLPTSDLRSPATTLLVRRSTAMGLLGLGSVLVEGLRLIRDAIME